MARRDCHMETSHWKYVTPSVDTVSFSQSVLNKYDLLIMVHEINNMGSFKNTGDAYSMIMKCCLRGFEELAISSVIPQCFIPLLDFSFFLTLLALLACLTLSFRDIEKYWKCTVKRWEGLLCKWRNERFVYYGRSQTKGKEWI